ncbi:MAG: hypothetical protein CMF52_03080 [Legionellales bacterium]|nr:hypothetical protein [Legionellales bacterium]
MKTPVKSNTHYVSADYLKSIIPKERKIISLILSSGQIECDLAFNDFNITAFTNRWANYEFWDSILKDPYKIADLADGMHKQLNPQMVFLLQNNWVKMKDPFFRSAIYFILNRYSYDGTISHGDFNSSNYSAICSRSLINFYENNEIEKIKIKYYKAEKYYDVLEDIDPSEILLLPVGPIKIGPLNKNIYTGHEMYDLDYGVLRKLLRDYQKDFIAIFKYNKKIIDDFRHNNVIMIDDAGIATENSRACNEIVVHNLGVK